MLLSWTLFLNHIFITGIIITCEFGFMIYHITLFKHDVFDEYCHFTSAFAFVFNNEILSSVVSFFMVASFPVSTRWQNHEITKACDFLFHSHLSIKKKHTSLRRWFNHLKLIWNQLIVNQFARHLAYVTTPRIKRKRTCWAEAPFYNISMLGTGNLCFKHVAPLRDT